MILEGYNIIVTGGGGFIGSHLTDELLKKGNKVTVIDNFSTGKIENWNQKANLIVKDINDVRSCEIKNHDYVFHLAAIPRMMKSILNPIETNRANIDGTLNMLWASKKAKIKKFIYASSSSIYGDQKYLPISEDAEKSPKSPYALQKYVGEEYCRLFNELYGFPTVSCRFFNVYGPRQDDQSDYCCVIGKFLKFKREGKPATIYGDGKQTRDFTYVNDIVNGLILAMEKGPSGMVFNLGAGKNVSVNEIAEIINAGDIEYVEARQGEPQDTLADITAANTILGWKSKISIKKGIESCI